MRKTKLVKLRRKREGKTNYRKRLSLLKSGKLRLVVRTSLKHVLVQVVKYEDDGDRILVSANSSELRKYGWDNYLRNLPASYLTGLVCGIKAKKQGLNHFVLDVGLKRLFKGNVIYTAMKGVLDSGVEVAHGEEIFPSEERLKGQHISEKVVKDFETVKAKILKEA